MLNYFRDNNIKTCLNEKEFMKSMQKSVGVFPS
jgi:hypothetical protein